MTYLGKCPFCCRLEEWFKVFEIYEILGHYCPEVNAWIFYYEYGYYNQDELDRAILIARRRKY